MPMDEEHLMITVVIPAYNRAGTIGAAIESVCRQTHTNWETVVVDDGSTDDTPQIVRRLAAADRRIRLVQHDTNRGAQAARNTGIREARSDWIAFLDSDDQLLADSLEVRLETALREKVLVVHSDYYILEEGEPRRLWGARPLAGNVYRELLERQGPMFQGLLVRKEALEKIGWLDESIGRYQEWETSIRLAEHYRFAFVPTPTFVYDCRGEDALSKNASTTGPGYQRVVRKHFWAILRHGGPRCMAGHYRMAASRYFLGGQRAAGIRCRVLFVLWWFLDPRNYIKKLRQFLGCSKTDGVVTATPGREDAR